MAFLNADTGRTSAPAVPFSFAGCGSSSSSGGGGGAAAGTPSSGSSGCTIVQRGACADVTDASYLQARARDSTAAAGAPPFSLPRSQLFEVQPAKLSSLGPPRTEPTLPAAAPPPPPEERYSSVNMPDASWWTRRRLQQQSSSSFDWPVPLVTGDRPPLGVNGTPAGTAPRLRLCSSRSFAYSMIFGPLAPSACGIYEARSAALLHVVLQLQSCGHVYTCLAITP